MNKASRNFGIRSGSPPNKSESDDNYDIEYGTNDRKNH
jgi:hypothetical protein